MERIRWKLWRIKTSCWPSSRNLWLRVRVTLSDLIKGNSTNFIKEGYTCISIIWYRKNRCFLHRYTLKRRSLIIKNLSSYFITNKRIIQIDWARSLIFRRIFRSCYTLLNRWNQYSKWKEGFKSLTTYRCWNSRKSTWYDE